MRRIHFQGEPDIVRRWRAHFSIQESEEAVMLQREDFRGVLWAMFCGSCFWLFVLVVMVLALVVSGKVRLGPQ